MFFCCCVSVTKTGKSNHLWHCEHFKASDHVRCYWQSRLSLQSLNINVDLWQTVMFTSKLVLPILLFFVFKSEQRSIVSCIQISSFIKSFCTLFFPFFAVQPASQVFRMFITNQSVQIVLWKPLTLSYKHHPRTSKRLSQHTRSLFTRSSTNQQPNCFKFNNF